MTSLLLGVLELERDPLRLADLGVYLRAWVHEAGLISAAGLVIYALATMFSSGRERSRVLPLVLLCAIGALACYAVAGVSWMQEPPPPPPPVNAAGVIQKAPPAPPTPQGERKELFLSIAGVLSLIGIALPFLLDLLACRPGRVWALAKLSFKEAIRRRVLFVFLGFLLLFLFPTKWFVQVKPEDEIRQTVSVIDLAMTVILVLAFGLLAALSLPTDIKNQTIHTIVTKPVQRFEIVLGRFLGFVGLATAVLLVLRTVSLIMIVYSNPSVESSFESFQARDPVFGTLRFFNRRGEFEGEFVGREWELRKYIAGGANSSHRALFQFKDIPAGFLTAEQVPCEFSFDIFRTTKGEEEGRGVQVSLFFSTPGWTDDKLPDYLAEMRRLGLNPARNPAPGDPDWKKWNELAEKFGYFELKGKEIADYHTFRIYVPAGLFKRGVTAAGPEMVPVACRVKCESRTQFLGVAARDLYFLSGNQPFWLNFYKGAFGIWLLVTLVIGLAVSLSTFFSGVVSWLVAVGIVMLGYFREFIQEVAEGRAVGGGSLESGLRIVTNSNIISPLDNTPGAVAAQTLDVGIQKVYGRILSAIPDVDRFDWSAYVAGGFNIPGVEMALAALVLAGYLIPWLVLAYYLLKAREVAN